MGCKRNSVATQVLEGRERKIKLSRIATRKPFFAADDWSMRNIRPLSARCMEGVFIDGGMPVSDFRQAAIK